MLLDIEKNIRNCLCIREIVRRFFEIKDMQTVIIHSIKFGRKTSIKHLKIYIIIKEN